MAEAQALVDRLLSQQNRDGGWSYNKGSSWAEPTAFAILALQSVRDRQVQGDVVRGLTYLAKTQRASGGWSPRADVAECTAVTSVVTLALLACQGTAPEGGLHQALSWIADQVYRDDLSLSLLLSRAFKLPPLHAPGSVPWYPGTAGWVTPTSLTALTLMKAYTRTQEPRFENLARKCCAYLLERRCADGGWNHGGSPLRGDEPSSYPETTGVALLALRAAKLELPTSAVQLAREFAKRPGSVEGLAYIQMGLGNAASWEEGPEAPPPSRTNRDVALRLLALNARNQVNVLLTA